MLLKAPHIYLLDTKVIILVSAVPLINAICFTVVLFCTRHGGCGVGCWWVDSILLLLPYSYIILIPVVCGRFAATATAAAAADRCSFSLISPLAVVAVVWLL